MPRTFYPSGMKVTFVKPPSGPGVSGSDMVPEFGSANCPSRSRMETETFEIKESDIQKDENGRFYFTHPRTGQRRYTDAPNHRVTFTPIP